MHIGTSIQPRPFVPRAIYALDGTPFQIVQKTNDLGVVVQPDFNFTFHIYTKYSKAGSEET